MSTSNATRTTRPRSDGHHGTSPATTGETSATRGRRKRMKIIIGKYEATIYPEGDGYTGAISLGFDAAGRRQRGKRKGRTKAQVKDKLREVADDLDAGVIAAQNYTVREAVEDFLDQGMKGKAPGTGSPYRRVPRAAQSAESTRAAAGMDMIGLLCADRRCFSQAAGGSGGPDLVSFTMAPCSGCGGGARCGGREDGWVPASGPMPGGGRWCCWRRGPTGRCACRTGRGRCRRWPCRSRRVRRGT